MAYPILDCIHIEAKDGKGTATGSNLEFFASHEFDCDVELSLCVSGKRLQRVLAASTGDSITLQQDGLKLTLDDGASKCTFDLLDPKDFPVMYDSDGDDFPIPSKAIKQVSPAVCTVDTPDNAALLGVLLDHEGYAVAFDRRRVHTAKIAPTGKDAIIPTSLANILAGLDGMMRCGDKFMVAHGEKWKISGKIIERKYGNWRSLHGFKPEQEIPIPPDLCDNIRRAMDCSSNQMTPGVLFQWGKIEVPDYSVECDLDTGFAFKIDPNYFQQAIKSAGEGATLGFTNALSMFVIKQGEFMAGLMPIRLN